jgi:hypothetical protein
MDNTENNQANYEFPENVFGDFDNEDIPNIINYDNNFDIDINVLIPMMNAAMNDAINDAMNDEINDEMNDEIDPIHVICEMTEEVPLRKKPRLHFTYEDIEN